MINSRLIMLEGMPSTGKTTNSRFIDMQLERNNINAKWIHEVTMPHPVLFFDEIGMTHDEYNNFIKEYPSIAHILNDIAVFKESTVGIHLPEIKWHYRDKIDDDILQALMEFNVWKYPVNMYKKFALEKWEHFTDSALKDSETVYVIDSAIFQFQIFMFLLNNRPYEELQSFINQIEEIIKPLNPCMIYLYRSNKEETIDYLENDRGTSYLEYIRQRDKDHPYYEGKPLGAESFKQFLREYGTMADLLFDSFKANKKSLEISGENWVYLEDQILSFLGIKRVTNEVIVPKSGVYKNKEFGFIIKVDGLTVTDPNENTRRIYPKSNNEFYVDWLPTVLKFEDNKIVISGSQVVDFWTKTGMVYEKVV